MLADIYSLAIILFELFSGVDPFPGNIGQICCAKFKDEMPDIPQDFPTALKDLVCSGWSEKPRERPEIEKFKSALRQMIEHEEESGSSEASTSTVVQRTNSQEAKLLRTESEGTTELREIRVLFSEKEELKLEEKNLREQGKTVNPK